LLDVKLFVQSAAGLQQLSAACSRISRAICSQSRVARSDALADTLVPVDREHSHPQQPRLSAQSQHLAEQIVQRALVTNPESARRWRDRARDWP
jgi:hypothetical protein